MPRWAWHRRCCELVSFEALLTHSCASSHLFVFASHSPLPPCLPVCSFLITNTDYSFIGITTQKLGLLVAILMSALGGILLTALLHGELLAIMGAGFQYWVMQPVFFNMLQVRRSVRWLGGGGGFSIMQ